MQCSSRYFIYIVILNALLRYGLSARRMGEYESNYSVIFKMNPYEQLAYGPIKMVKSLIVNRQLIVKLVYREVSSRYRGSMLGMLWSLLTPLFILSGGGLSPNARTGSTA